MSENIFKYIKRTLVGSPIHSSEAHHQRLSKRKALATFSSDPLSSVAYATEEILLVLMLAGTSALHLSIPISLTIIALLFIVVISYRQTIYAYPSGGGAYIVAKENLGENAGLIAAAALLTDYVLTVAVSVAAGIAAITSAFPSLQNHTVLFCIISIVIVTLMNLRGIRESSTIFAFPTYAFIFSILIMLGVGSYKMFTGSFTHIAPQDIPAQHTLTMFLILRAFSSGCTALTGVEAVSNGVPVFHPPESRNASRTLIIMVCILTVMFFGITYFAHFHGIVPSENETVISQLARSIFGSTFFYYFTQFTTMGILILAANTSYADFPRLASILAKDRYLPRQLTSLGDRLVFSNGIVVLGFLAVLLIILFNASTHALIPLYAVGVFLSFTLSQFGMVKHWFTERKKGWLRQAFVNAVGGILTGIVTIVFSATKFTHGAWIIVILIPFFIYVFKKINKHYLAVGKQLSLIGTKSETLKISDLKHTVIIPISGLHKGILQAIKYGLSVSSDVRALYVEVDLHTTERLQFDWVERGQGIPLVILKSPYRSVIEPLLDYIDEIRNTDSNVEVITVLIPEFVTAKWWQTLLHNQTAFLMRARLAFKRNLVVTSIRYHLDV